MIWLVGPSLLHVSSLTKQELQFGEKANMSRFGTLDSLKKKDEEDQQSYYAGGAGDQGGR